MIENEYTQDLERRIEQLGKLRDAQPLDSPARSEFDAQITALTDRFRTWQAHEVQLVEIDAAVSRAEAVLLNEKAKVRAAGIQSLNAANPWKTVGTVTGVFFIAGLLGSFTPLSGGSTVFLMVIGVVGVGGSVVMAVRSAQKTVRTESHAQSRCNEASEKLAALQMVRTELMERLRDGRVAPPEYGAGVPSGRPAGPAGPSRRDHLHGDHDDDGELPAEIVAPRSSEPPVAELGPARDHSFRAPW